MVILEERPAMILPRVWISGSNLAQNRGAFKPRLSSSALSERRGGGRDRSGTLFFFSTITQ